MGYHCDFCREQRSIVYCKSDAASLCLSCDRNVHSANALSRRHSRTLVCERCNCQPAFVRCSEERVSLCQNCYLTGHSGSNTCSSHSRQPVNCYSGCPSAAELSEIWSFLLDFPSVGDSTCEQEMGSMSIMDNNPIYSQGNNKDQNGSFVAETNYLHHTNMNGSTDWMESLTPLLGPKSYCADQQEGTSCSAIPKVVLSEAKEPGDDFDMDEVDLHIENYEELFGVALNNPEQLFDDGLFRMDMFGSNYQGVYTAEGSSGRKVNMPACSCNVASADSAVSCKTEPNLCFAHQAHSSVSFSGLTGDSSAGDIQDCGASSIPIVGEPPWMPENSMSSSRSDAVRRYKEKKKSRKFDKVCISQGQSRCKKARERPLCEGR